MCYWDMLGSMFQMDFGVYTMSPGSSDRFLEPMLVAIGDNVTLGARSLILRLGRCIFRCGAERVTRRPIQP